MAKYDWGFDILNKDTAHRDGVVQVQDTKTGTSGHFALSEYTGDGEWGDCIYAESGFRERDAYSALSTWGWI